MLGARGECCVSAISGAVWSGAVLFKYIPCMRSCQSVAGAKGSVLMRAAGGGPQLLQCGRLKTCCVVSAAALQRGASMRNNGVLQGCRGAQMHARLVDLRKSNAETGMEGPMAMGCWHHSATHSLQQGDGPGRPACFSEICSLGDSRSSQRAALSTHGNRVAAGSSRSARNIVP